MYEKINNKCLMCTYSYIENHCYLKDSGDFLYVALIKINSPINRH